MIETFRQIASQIKNPFIEDWKAAGKPVISGLGRNTRLPSACA